MTTKKFRYQNEIRGFSNETLQHNYESLLNDLKRDPYYRHSDHALQLELVTEEMKRRNLV